jgi:hypothetical protein
LIGLGFRTFTLKIDPLHHAGLGENMMAA